ncbi:MAG: hypothetical protein KDC61_00855 [Saprospiraceae bacterium]|nr:hypothetical protein [Saprospiraceae bacterium]MCB0545445.1 hypothetical protein [Saprospiraceae bacterium]MCB0573100.1 hypothetical protein [Saprospiraceae bacterium]MCB9356033.1 hypothetical protein [Lewinellaceae bacterium]
MKIKHLLLLFTLSAAMISINACKSEDDDHGDDHNDPVLTITSPTENESFLGEVHIELTVTDESLHSLSIKVTKDSDGSVVYEDSPTVHDETDYDYHEHFTPAGLSGLTDMTLTVVVEDHSAHVVTKTVKFTAQ